MIRGRLVTISIGVMAMLVLLGVAQYQRLKAEKARVYLLESEVLALTATLDAANELLSVKKEEHTLVSKILAEKSQEANRILADYEALQLKLRNLSNEKSTDCNMLNSAVTDSVRDILLNAANHHPRQIDTNKSSGGTFE